MPLCNILNVPLLLLLCIKTTGKKEKGWIFYILHMPLLCYVVKTVVPPCLTQELILQLNGQHSLSTACRLAEWSVRHYSATDRERGVLGWACLSVCVCPRSYLHNYTPDLHQIFCARYLWPWLSLPLPAYWYVTYCRFYGWRNICSFAHKLIGCLTSPPGWGSEAHSQPWAWYVAIPTAGGGCSGIPLRQWGSYVCSLRLGA